MLNYKVIEIFTSEEARYRRKNMAEAVVQYIKGLKIAARCIVTRGVAGCYESGEVTTGRVEVLSFNMPIRIYIVLPEADLERVLDGLNDLVEDGIVALHDLNVLSHRAKNAFFPRQLSVRDVMTRNPTCMAASSPLSEAVGILLSSIFSGLPVVDQAGRPIGVITQGDLISKAGLPLRLGLLAESGPGLLDKTIESLNTKKAAEVMTMPAVTIRDDRPLGEAVDLMLSANVKRLPVVDESGRLTGMLSRLDIFRTVMRESPDWNSFRAQRVEITNLKLVKDILRRDTHTVSPETSIAEVIRIIGQNDIQRVAVVDTEQKLLGLISDRDLLGYFKQEQDGLWKVLARMKRSAKTEPFKSDLQQRLAETKAADLMKTDLITVREKMLIEEAIGLMTEKALKRLPVVDEFGRFKGMISRDSLLRTGFMGSA